MVATEFADGVLRLTLARPEKRNALSDGLIAAIGATFAEWSTREDVSLAVLTGSGDKAFASGGDLKELDALRGEAEARAFAARTRAAFDHIRRFPVPVLAILNGDALGGGAELAMACDQRLALAHARIGFLQAKLNCDRLGRRHRPFHAGRAEPRRAHSRHRSNLLRHRSGASWSCRCCRPDWRAGS